MWAPWIGKGAPSLRHHLNRHLRYFTVMPCDTYANGTRAHVADIGALTCLFFKEDVWETWVVGTASEDGLAFNGAGLVLPPPLPVLALY